MAMQTNLAENMRARECDLLQLQPAPQPGLHKRLHRHADRGHPQYPDSLSPHLWRRPICKLVNEGFFLLFNSDRGKCAADLRW
jgi:hypothetical protein